MSREQKQTLWASVLIALLSGSGGSVLVTRLLDVNLVEQEELVDLRERTFLVFREVCGVVVSIEARLTALGKPRQDERIVYDQCIEAIRRELFQRK